MNLNKTLYGIIGVVVIAVALFFVGRLSAPPQPIDEDPKYIKMQNDVDSVNNLRLQTVDSLLITLDLIEMSKIKYDSLNIAYQKRYNKKSKDYENLLRRYNNLSDDSLQTIIVNRLNKSIKERINK